MRILKIKRIKNSIRKSWELLQTNNPIMLDEKTVKTTNCYAYALGIMYNGKRGIDFIPGFTKKCFNHVQNIENEEQLMKKIQIDLENLSISYRRIGLEEEKQLKENEYLVKVFYTPPNKELPKGDFHFVRQDRDTQIWFHKMGWNRQPEIIKSDPEGKQIIPGTEPTTITWYGNNGFYYVYTPVEYLAITEN